MKEFQGIRALQEMRAIQAYEELEQFIERSPVAGQKLPHEILYLGKLRRHLI
jgi:hypothetical protein